MIPLKKKSKLTGRTWSIRKIKPIDNYTKDEIVDLVSLFDPQSLAYDYVIDRLFFVNPDRKRSYQKNRLEYSIVTARGWTERQQPVLIGDFWAGDTA